MQWVRSTPVFHGVHLGVTINALQQNNSRFQGAPSFVNQQRPQFQPQQPIQSGLEDLMKSFIVKTYERLMIMVQLSKNLGQNLQETVNVLTLRRGQVLKDPTPIQKEVAPEKESEKELKIEDDKKTEKKKGKKGVEKNRKEETSRREKYDDFTDVLSQMLTYAKFLKEILTKKRKIEETKKLENEIGEIRSTPISLQLADQTTIIPHGIVEYVLVLVDKFVFPLDFIVVNMEENKEIPLILEKPFLATGRVILDIHERKLMLRVSEEMVTFEMNVATR
ncbi:uncharacterized protein [Nicotiana tomentosiformis]|uniref:uncharacterized protein n=1 Tax=Nicotiana tomentosiformis TaxID=4098 RepID=UPI00388CE3E0